MNPTDSDGHASAWNKLTMTANTQDVCTADHVPGRYSSALATTIDPLTLVPLPAYGTRLRGVVFIFLDCATGLVVELCNHLCIAGATDSLRLPSPNLLSGIVKRLAHMTGCTGECFGHFAGRLVRQVSYPVGSLVQQLGFAPLQLAPPARACSLPTLRLLDAGEILVAPLEGRLDSPSADQDSCFPIGRCDQGVDAQVHTDHGLLRARFIRYLTDKQDLPHAQAGFHQASGQVYRNGDAQFAGAAVGQNQLAISNNSTLVGVDNVSELWFLPGILRFWMAVLAQLTSGVDRFAELPDDLLHGLRMQVRVLTLRPLFPTLLARPLPVKPADAVMPFDQIAPQPSRFLASQTEGTPFALRLRHPVHAYSSVSHIDILPHGKKFVESGGKRIELKLSATKKPHVKPLYPTAEAGGLYGLRW